LFLNRVSCLITDPLDTLKEKIDVDRIKVVQNFVYSTFPPFSLSVFCSVVNFPPPNGFSCPLISYRPGFFFCEEGASSWRVRGSSNRPPPKHFIFSAIFLSMNPFPISTVFPVQLRRVLCFFLFVPSPSGFSAGSSDRETPFVSSGHLLEVAHSSLGPYFRFPPGPVVPPYGGHCSAPAPVRDGPLLSL